MIRSVEQCPNNLSLYDSYSRMRKHDKYIIIVSLQTSIKEDIVKVCVCSYTCMLGIITDT